MIVGTVLLRINNSLSLAMVLNEAVMHTVALPH